MGQAIIAAARESSSVAIAAELHEGSSFAALDGCDVAIDFTSPDGSVFNTREAAKRGIPVVIGTTGLNHLQRNEIEVCANTIPIVHSANMSVGVNLLAALVEDAARKLGIDYDIEIVEMHHRRKVDAPSGTALMLGNAAAKGRGDALENLQAYGDRTYVRTPGQIGFASLRGGDVAGDHSVIFAGEGERLELTHRASNRTVFAQGALRAAEWLIGKPPGLYAMADVLKQPSDLV